MQVYVLTFSDLGLIEDEKSVETHEAMLEAPRLFTSLDDAKAAAAKDALEGYEEDALEWSSSVGDNPIWCATSKDTWRAAWRITLVELEG